MTTSPSLADLPTAVLQPATPIEEGLSGAVRLSHLGVIRAVGVEAGKFLQGQLTQDITGMGLDEARLAAFCNAKGRMQASFVVFKRKNTEDADDILMVCSHDLLAQTLKRLSMFVMRAKVKLSDATADFSLYGLCGSAADALNAINSGASHASINWLKHDIDASNCIEMYLGAGIARSLWCAPIESPPPSGAPMSLSNWHYLEVQSGIAMVTLPIFEAFVPQMLNYESVGGVNFKKGCYPGQEVVARSQFRGTLKRRAYVAHCAYQAGATPHVGQEVFHESDAEQPCGLVAASAADPAGGFAVILAIQTSASTGRLTLGSSIGGELTIAPLPYPLLEDI